MLHDATLVAFAAITDTDAARAFYVDLLGLREVEDSPFALVLDANGTTLRLQKVPEHRPAPFTSLGWHVPDAHVTLAQLVAKGVRAKRYDFLPQDEHGVWAAPSGAKIAWFEDPSGNVLSITSA